MINEEDLSIEELMNFGINYGSSVDIDIKELKRLFDTKDDKKEFQKNINYVKNVLIEQYRLPEPAVVQFFNYGKIILFESNSILKQFYINYGVLIQFVLGYFCNNISSNEVTRIMSGDNIDEIKSNINQKLKTVREEIKNCSNINELEQFCSNHSNVFYDSIKKVGENGKFKATDLIEEMEKQINAVIVNHKHLIEFVQGHVINNSLFDKINKEKFAFYLAGSTLQECMLSKETNLSIYYAINYYMHKIEDEIPNINVTINGNNYSFIVFSRQLRQYIQTHKNVDIIKFKKDTFSDCTPEEVRGYLQDFHNNTLDNFDIVETDDIYIPNGTNTGVRKQREQQVQRRKPTKPQEISKLTLQKRKFYRENKEQIYATLMGKNKFEGYVAHVLKNGYVIFEKHDKNSNMISNQSGAAYIMTINNFNELSKKSIPEIRFLVKNNNGSDINYICHKGNWMERLQRIINGNTGISLSQIDRFLIKANSAKRG